MYELCPCRRRLWWNQLASSNSIICLNIKMKITMSTWTEHLVFVMTLCNISKGLLNNFYKVAYVISSLKNVNMTDLFFFSLGRLHQWRQQDKRTDKWELVPIHDIQQCISSASLPRAPYIIKHCSVIKGSAISIDHFTLQWFHLNTLAY